MKALNIFTSAVYVYQVIFKLFGSHLRYVNVKAWPIYIHSPLSILLKEIASEMPVPHSLGKQFSTQ